MAKKSLQDQFNDLQAENNALENALVEIWAVAQKADGSRVEQQAALDDIQAKIEAQIDDVEEQADELDESDEDDGESE
jgi:cytochrome c556